MSTLERRRAESRFRLTTRARTKTTRLVTKMRGRRVHEPAEPRAFCRLAIVRGRKHEKGGPRRRGVRGVRPAVVHAERLRGGPLRPRYARRRARAVRAGPGRRARRRGRALPHARRAHPRRARRGQEEAVARSRRRADGGKRRRRREREKSERGRAPAGARAAVRAAAPGGARGGGTSRPPPTIRTTTTLRTTLRVVVRTERLRGAKARRKTRRRETATRTASRMASEGSRRRSLPSRRLPAKSAFFSTATTSRRRSACARATWRPSSGETPWGTSSCA